jgi:hypothetical protein
MTRLGRRSVHPFLKATTTGLKVGRLQDTYWTLDAGVQAVQTVAGTGTSAGRTTINWHSVHGVHHVVQDVQGFQLTRHAGVSAPLRRQDRNGSDRRGWRDQPIRPGWCVLRDPRIPTTLNAPNGITSPQLITFQVTG